MLNEYLYTSMLYVSRFRNEKNNQFIKQKLIHVIQILLTFYIILCVLVKSKLQFKYINIAMQNNYYKNESRKFHYPNDRGDQAIMMVEWEESR